MADKVTLRAQPRDGGGKGFSRKTRASGRVPAVIYGHGEATRSLTVDAHELSRLIATVHYENTIIHLDIEGERGEVRALVRELQRDPVRDIVLHVDFHQIHKGEKIHVSVPIVLKGTPAGVRAGGMLQHALNDLEIRVDADAIPEHIEMDVSDLGIGDSIHVRDIPVAAGVEVLADGDRSVCSVIPPTVVVTEAEEVAPEPTVEGEPEVIRRRKEEEEAE